MRKLINGVLFLLIVFIVAAPFGVGMLIESQYNQNIAQLNQIYSGQLAFKGTFNRGYINSSAVTEITMSNSKEVIKLLETIHNGPIILDFKSPTDFNSYIPKDLRLAVIDTVIENHEADNWLKKIYNGKPAYKISTVLEFNGDGTTTIVNYPFEMPLGSGKITWKGMTLSVSHNKDLSVNTGSFTLPQFSYGEATPDGVSLNELKIIDVKSNFVTGKDVPLETVSFNISSIIMTSNGKVVYNADKIASNADYQKLNNIVKSNAAYTFNKMVFGADEYGPMSLTLKLANLNYDIIDTLTAKISANSSAAKNSKDLLDLNATPEQLKSLLTPGPSADLDFSLTTPKGNVSVKGNASAGGKSLTSTEPDAILATVNAKALIQVGQELLYQALAQYAETQIIINEKTFSNINKDPSIINPYTLTPAAKQTVIENWMITLLDKLKDMGLIVENDKVLISDITYSNNAFIFNTKEVKLQDLKSLKPDFEIVITPKAKPAVIAPAATTVPGVSMPVVPVTPSTVVPSVPVTTNSTAIAPSINE